MSGARTRSGEIARETYESFAPNYDLFNRRYQYERWTGRLATLAAEAGVRGTRLLDVGCGTGLSFVSMLARGWTVTACDLSPAMLARARVRAEGRARLIEADMRELPELGEHDLAWAVNDAVNYLLCGEDLRAALAGMRRNIAATGLVLFDLNTLATYRAAFGEGEVEVVEHADRRLLWRGLTPRDRLGAGSLAEARIEAADQPSLTHVHLQRHFGEAEVLAAIEAAGLSSAGVWGERDGELEPRLDEDRHTKAVYLCAA